MTHHSHSQVPKRHEPPPPAPLPEQYSHIKRHFDPQIGVYSAKLLPGDYYVTTTGEAINTVLGSCVSACVRDPIARIGGMNHFMLPLEGANAQGSWGSLASAATRFGNVAMERMINDVLKLGGRRERLEFKLVGGGRVLNISTDVGARNIEFVRNYVKTEGFRVVGEDLGDEFPRRVLYLPESGKVRVKKLSSQGGTSLSEREQRYLKDLDSKPVAGDVELF